jgi:hypothetical protein
MYLEGALIKNKLPDIKVLKTMQYITKVANKSYSVPQAAATAD